MDQDIKKYADALYESAQMESGRRLGQEWAEAAQSRTWSRADLALAAPDLQIMHKVYDDHIKRSVDARFESYQQAYEETAGRIPTDDDFAEILSDCQAVRILEVGRSAGAIRQSIGARAIVGVLGLNFQIDLENSSAHADDLVLQKLKTWKAKTQLKRAPHTVPERKKHRDVLVPAYNKAEFVLDLAALTAKGTDVWPVSLLYMDLDKFKSINDGPGGHEAGDRALQEFATSLLQVCDGKGNVYRWGGDEFCVLLPNHSIEEATPVAERIRQTVREIRTDELQDGLSTSVGVACFPGSTADPSKLVSQADQAMYASKEAGGNLVSKITTVAKPPSKSQTTTQQACLTEVISELEDNLERTRAPRIGDAYRRPSSEGWKNSLNKIELPEPLRSDVVQIYREIDDWLTVVESGVHPNMGSPALNNTTASLATRLPGVIAELKKLG